MFFCYSDLWDCLLFTVTFVRVYIASFVCAVQTVNIWNVNIGCCSNNVGVGLKPTDFSYPATSEDRQNGQLGIWFLVVSVTMCSHRVEFMRCLRQHMLLRRDCCICLYISYPDTTFQKLLSFRQKQMSYTYVNVFQTTQLRCLEYLFIAFHIMKKKNWSHC